MIDYKKDYLARMKRNAEKKKILLRFLRTERYISIDNVALLFDVIALPPLYRFLSQMEKEGFLRSESYDLGRSIKLWGLTPHGVAFSFDEDEPIKEVIAFQKSRVSIQNLMHHLAVQKLSILSERNGLGSWVRSACMPRQGIKIPDAISHLSDGKKMAIEVERTVKTLKRYREIVVSYLLNMSGEGWDSVWYIMPNIATKKRVESMILSIDDLSIHPAFSSILYIKEEIKKHFQFFTYDFFEKKY